MTNITHRDYSGIEIYRLREKIFLLKGLLAECVGFIDDMLESELDEDAEYYLLDLQKRVKKN
nr:MAG TPA: hypothetical protein [Caudoviricetes sp.]